MVEFALIAPILLYLVLSIPVFGLITRSWLVISAAARDGARQASLYNPSEGSLTDRDREELARRVAAGSVTLERGPGGAYFRGTEDVEARVSGGMVTVTVTYRQPSYLPFLPLLLNPKGGPMRETLELRATARFVVEGI
jgi:Flp pilus assembly protein TadG